jgi:hypothetical protein
VTAKVEHRQGDKCFRGLNPNATRVMSRILVFTDSMRPFDSPCSMAARIDAWCLTMRRCGRRRRRCGSVVPIRSRSRARRQLRRRALEDQPQASLKQVGPVQPRVGPGYPGQLGLLAGGEVLGVLPQREPGVLERLGVPAGPARPALVRGAAGLVPGLPADLVKSVGGPADHVERIGAAHRVGTAVDDGVADPVRAVRRHVGDLGAASLAAGFDG